MLQMNQIKNRYSLNDCFFNEKYREYKNESVFSLKSRKFRIIFLRSFITSYVKSDKIYPFAQRCQFSMFWPVDKHYSWP